MSNSKSTKAYICIEVVPASTLSHESQNCSMVGLCEGSRDRSMVTLALKMPRHLLLAAVRLDPSHGSSFPFKPSIWSITCNQDITRLLVLTKFYILNCCPHKMQMSKVSHSRRVFTFKTNSDWFAIYIPSKARFMKQSFHGSQSMSHLSR